MWCWRRLLRVPRTARRSNQSILKEISPEYSLEGLILKLKLQHSGHLMCRTDLLEKTLKLTKTEGRRRRPQRMRWLDGITDLMDMSLSKLWSLWWTVKPGVLQSTGLQRVNWVSELNRESFPDLPIQRGLFLYIDIKDWNSHVYSLFTHLFSIIPQLNERFRKTGTCLLFNCCIPIGIQYLLNKLGALQNWSVHFFSCSLIKNIYLFSFIGS